jgi:hypothetical protein
MRTPERSFVMDPVALPEYLHPDRRRQAAADDFPITQINPVTGYTTSLVRQGDFADFLGWLTLLNGNKVAGIIVFTPNAQVPELGDTGYVGMYFPPEALDPVLRILQSGEPLQVRFLQSDASSQPFAYLEHRQ